VLRKSKFVMTESRGSSSPLCCRITRTSYWYICM